MENPFKKLKEYYKIHISHEWGANDPFPYGEGAKHTWDDLQEDMIRKKALNEIRRQEETLNHEKFIN